ncbi:DUF2065 domain-containing protein [Candidatus Albibeggiatoa sp. nov. NOAA]|uniref:DUF2065 domain-containing protein n=1 Tax=Candidatus Albibeggiatoa sp. nov. NOAA TaxID=3162724 RepID=UPI0033035382|nr:DUF2065 domain-containing protein [Thiotrichaceae bacterium]
MLNPEFWPVLLSAIALVFVIEGIMPFLSPTTWRRTLISITEMEDGSLRIMGFLSMIFGILLLYLVR